jgi:hypothetical protein
MAVSFPVFFPSAGREREKKIISSGRNKIIEQKRSPKTSRDQGCQMVNFLTKNSNLGKFWWGLQWKMLVYFVDIWSILRPFDIFLGIWFIFVVIWHIGKLY